MKLSFTVYGHPEPQGSTRAFVPKGWKRPIITTDNKKLKPWRQEVTRAAIDAVTEAGGEIIPRGTPVLLRLDFYLLRPPSLPKRVTRPTSRPDVSKLLRSVEDSLTGVVYEDDSQITVVRVTKQYGTPERVEITAVAEGSIANSIDESKATMELFA